MTELSAIFKKAPKEAARYLAQKRRQPSEGWETVSAQAHQHAFTVAQTTGFDVLGDIKDALARARDEGWSVKQFQDNLKPMLQAKGWWGKAIDPDTGEILRTYPNSSKPVRYGSSARLRLVYDTNMATSYAAGRRERQLATAKLFPYWRYVAVMDGRTRPTHRRLNGQVWPADHPLWTVNYPPQGFRCRCTVQALRQADIDRAGLRVQDSAGDFVERQVPVNSGRDLMTVRGWKARDGREFWPDPGFDTAPGALGHASTERLFKAARRALPQPAALDAVRRHMASDVARAGWGAFVSSAKSTAPFSRGRTAALGVLSDQDMVLIASNGRPTESPVVYVDDKHVGGGALNATEWAALYATFSGPARVFWDGVTQAMTKVYRLGNGKMVAVDVGRFRQIDGDQVGRAARASRVSDAQLSAWIDSGRFEEQLP